MILFISSSGKSLESPPNPRFGRTEFFIKYDLEDDTWNALENPAAAQSGGAGVAASQYLVDQNANVAISGRFGPNAYRVLDSAKIDMLTFDKSHNTIKDVIDAFKDNSLEKL